MDLRPITKIKISKEEWLQQPIKYEDELLVKDIIIKMSRKSYQWIHDKDDLDVITDYDSFQNNFINLLYNKYLNE